MRMGMLIKLIQEKRTETFIIEEGSGRTISILNETCRIRLKDGRILLEVSESLKTEEAGKIQVYCQQKTYFHQDLL